MNRAMKIFSLLSLIALAMSCQKTPPVTFAPGALMADGNSGFVIRPGLGLYDISAGESTWHDGVLLGEKLSFLGETTKAPIGSDSRQYEFVHVKRDSGAVGWVLADYVVSRCVLSVAKIDDVLIYKEPKDAAATGRSLASATIVARSTESVTAPFARITWCDPATGALSQSQYVHDEDLSTKPDDVQVAVLLQLASAAKSPDQKKALLQSASRSYPSSLFIARVEDALAAIAAPAVTHETMKFVAPMVATDNGVNVRNAPDETAGAVVATLTKGQTVEVEEQTTESFTIGTDTAPWYHIKEPAGWVFGAWLTPE